MNFSRTTIPAWLVAVLLMMPALLTSCAHRSAEAPGTSLMGEGFGIDHAVLLVRDLDAARTQYANVFGFDLPETDDFGLHPSGTKNASAYFANQSYLELLAVDDAAKVAREKPYYPAFLSRFDGGVRFFALSTSSASQTWQWLNERGFAAPAPEPGRIIRPGKEDDGTPAWYTVDLADGEPPADLPFLIEYTDYPYAEVHSDWDAGYAEARSSGGYAQPNGVTGIRAVVLATGDLAALRATYVRMGLPEVESSVPGEARFRAAHGEIRLIAAAANPAAASFVASHGDGVMALEFNVADIAATGRFLSDHVHVNGVEARADGTIYVPAELAWGVDLVFVQE